MLRVFVGGEIFHLQARGGISSYFRQLLPRIAAQPDLDVELLVPPKLAGIPPDGFRLGHRPQFPFGAVVFDHIPQRFRRFAMTMADAWWGRKIDRTPSALFHSSYYVLPRLERTPRVCTVYDMIHERFAHLFNQPSDDSFREQKRRCVTSSERVLAISEATKRDLCEIYDVTPERVDVTPLGVDAEFWRSESSEERIDANRLRPGLPERYLLYVGDRNHYKNFATLAKAFAALRRGMECTLVVVGRDWSPDEQTLLSSLRIDQATRLIRHPGDGELAAIYAGACAFVYPSLYEGFGLPLLEAMACGTPVIAARAGSIPEVAGDAAEYFDPLAPDDLTAAMERVLAPDRAWQLRGLGAMRVEHFTWDRTAELTIDSYMRAMGRVRTQAAVA